jgi:allantoinase
MALDLLIRGGLVAGGIEPSPFGRGQGKGQDIGIAEGKFVELADEITAPAKQVIDATGLWVLPGVIDSHVHFNEPGRTHWEGIATGSAALAAGGGVCFFDMPLNSSPPTLDAASFNAKLAACQANSVTDFALWGGLTPANLDSLEELADCGVIGFKAFMCNSGIDDFLACDDDSLLRGMQTAAKLGLPVAVHAESDAMTAALTQAARAAGKSSPRDYLNTRPVAAEMDAIHRVLRFARETGCEIHIVHVSHPQSVGLLRSFAQKFVVDATCETCPHYFLLTEDDVLSQGAAAKCSPPLRPRADRDALLAALNEGLIDTVGSDHSPAPPEMKTSDNFFEVWGGISGVQMTLRAMITADIAPHRIAALVATNVARRFNLPTKGRIQVGYDADLVLVDPIAVATLSRDQLLDRHKFSPYLGRSFRGQIRQTLLRGQPIYDAGQVRNQKSGRLIRPKLA